MKVATKITPDKKKAEELQESINICHLNITPTGATSFAMVAPILFMVIAILIKLLLAQTY